MCMKNKMGRKNPKSRNPGKKKHDFVSKTNNKSQNNWTYTVEQEKHKATCSECGKECEVPFKPIEDRPVYCRDCYRKSRRY